MSDTRPLVHAAGRRCPGRPVATGPTKVYRAGDSFFEPPGSEHLVSENASATESASLLAVHIADDGAGLTTIDK